MAIGVAGRELEIDVPINSGCGEAAPELDGRI